MCVYGVRLAKGVERDLRRIRGDHRAQILEGIEEMLTYEPTVETRNRKQLVNLVPPFEAIPPVWELRIREYRVFYDVSEEEKVVYVRAVRRKSAHRSTGEIL
jgi:mRNA-degrading endonuclease RelE of RelBE toxin-antitoxin system